MELMIQLFSQLEEDILTEQNIEVTSKDWIMGSFHQPVSAPNTPRAESEHA